MKILVDLKLDSANVIRMFKNFKQHLLRLSEELLLPRVAFL
jgi:hypothetical protein